MAFPPAEEGFYAPAQLVNLGNFFSCQVESVGGYPRSMTADANEVRDWRIYADFAKHLIGIARKLYQKEPLVIAIEQTVYAFDSTTIDLCLSVFPWAHFRKAKAAVKLHTLIDLRGNIPTFIHISDGKLHDVKVLDVLPIEPGSSM